jgi:hypothetical protein
MEGGERTARLRGRGRGRHRVAGRGRRGLQSVLARDAGGWDRGAGGSVAAGVGLGASRSVVATRVCAHGSLAALGWERKGKGRRRHGWAWVGPERVGRAGWRRLCTGRSGGG